MPISRRTLMAGLVLAPGAARAGGAFDDLTGAALLRLEHGRLVPARLAPEVELLALYFGAGWCGPCRVFVPELRAAYPGLKRAQRRIEVVFVSDDASARAMADYVVQARMPWPCLSHEAARRSRRIQALRGLALPGMVVLDRANQTVIDSWVRPGDSRPHGALAGLREAAGA